ncbi:MAG TPA: hypothetical protein VJS43_17375, partial [Candidatus Acidoferrales bacterium]|nr:hypothetical protein [Candidatus Acidoferrales bacterium]
MRKFPSQRRDSRAFSAMCEELLGRGLNVRFRANGRSMQPNILDDDALIIAPGIAAGARRGEIAFTRGAEGFRVHRVVTSSRSGDRKVITRGDASLANDHLPGHSLGRVISIERGRRRIPAADTQAQMIHGIRKHARRMWLARRRRASAPLLGAFFLILFSLLAVAPASAQSLTVAFNPAPTSPVAPGDTITYTVVLTNPSRFTRVNGPVTVSMPDPTTTSFVSAAKTSGTGNWNCNNNGGTITCTDNANYGGRSTTTFLFVVTVNNGGSGTYTIPSTVTAQGANTAPATDSTSVTVEDPVLSVSNTPSLSPISPGDTLTYTIGLSNASGVTVTPNLTVTMADPLGLTFVSAAKTGGTGTWTCNNAGGTVTCTDTASYPNGSATTLGFVFTVNAVDTNGTVIPSTASAQGANTTSPGTASANVTVQTPDLSVANTPNPTQVATGGTITYTQVITNNGAEEAVGALLSETTPANTTFTSAAAPAGWTCGTLPPVGGTGTITCTANSGT